MKLIELVGTISDFDAWTHSDKIKFFAWFLHRHDGKETFKASDISKCYALVNASSPSNIGSFIAAMLKRKPAEALGTASKGFRLEKRVRDALDTRFGQRPTAVYVDKLLAGLPDRIPNANQKGYLEEALVCFRNAAFRAAIVMVWNLAYDHICELVIAKHLPDFNVQLPKSYPKADISAISKREDFEVLKESQVLQVCASANIISGNVHKIAKEKLVRRNIAAHPSSIVTTPATAEEFIRDLVENVVLQVA